MRRRPYVSYLELARRRGWQDYRCNGQTRRLVSIWTMKQTTQHLRLHPTKHKTPLGYDSHRPVKLGHNRRQKNRRSSCRKDIMHYTNYCPLNAPMLQILRSSAKCTSHWPPVSRNFFLLPSSVFLSRPFELCISSNGLFHNAHLLSLSFYPECLRLELAWMNFEILPPFSATIYFTPSGRTVFTFRFPFLHLPLSPKSRGTDDGRLRPQHIRASLLPPPLANSPRAPLLRDQSHTCIYAHALHPLFICHYTSSDSPPTPVVVTATVLQHGHGA